MSDTNCPHCGTPHLCCGTKIIRLSCRVHSKTTQSPLCREREAHNKTKRFAVDDGCLRVAFRNTLSRLASRARSLDCHPRRRRP
jgi:hypothetical protein